MTAFQIFSFTIWALALATTILGTLAALQQLNARPPHLDAPFSLYPISILKPLKGIDSGLEENLRSFFQIDYPDFEIIFCVPNSNDPALSVVRKLIQEFPRVNARLFVGEVNIGPNPKINNILRGYEDAENDWVLISDSNVRVKSDYLKRLVAHLRPGVGMVTAVVAGSSPEGVGGNLEATYLNTFYARWMSLTARFGKPCVVGKAMLFQRSTAARFGGLKTLSKFLAEDYMAGEAMRRLGLGVEIARDPVTQMIGDHSFHDFWSRHLRWGRIRRAQAPAAFLLEPLMGALASGVLGASAFHVLLGVPFAKFIFIHLALWSLCDFLIIHRMKQLSLFTPLFWFAREALAMPLWINIASGNSILWRGQRYKLLPGGTLC